MNASNKVRTILAAATPPEETGGGMAPPLPPGSADVGDGSAKRNIPKDFEYDPKALKPLARMMLSMSISLGHALTAYREFTRLKSATISPDGMLGGRGYVLKVKDVRTKIQQACEELSAVSDTIHDEINAPHWKPKMAQLPKEDRQDITNFLDDSKKIMDDPEAFGEKELNDIEDETEEERDVRFHPPAPPKNDFGSKVPGAGDPEVQAYKMQEKPGQKQASWGRPRPATPEERILLRFKKANSSIPVQTVPGGPRVQHLDRGDSDQTGPYGTYNSEEPTPTADQWGRDQGVGGEYNYPSEWDNNLSSKEGGGDLMQWGASATPDAQLDGTGTETEANDFGIGYGAKGKGSEGYGTVAPDGRGVAGPAARLPGEGAVPHGDGTSYVEQTHKTTYASYEEEASVNRPTPMSSVGRPTPMANSELPNDDEPPVARSDYYQGNKGNQFDVGRGESWLPGEGTKAKPTPPSARPAHTGEFMFGGDTLPGDGTDARTDHDMDLSPNVEQRSEDIAVPYVKRDWDIHDDRHDQQDLYNYDRTTNG